MEVKLGTHCVSMTPRALFPIATSSLLKFANHIQYMEVKLGTHVFFCVSTTTINKKWSRALFPITTSSLLKLANHTMHGGKLGTHVYFCISMMTTNKKHFSLQLLLHFSTLQTIQCMEVKLGMHMYFRFSMTTINKKWPLHFSL